MATPGDPSHFIAQIPLPLKPHQHVKLTDLDQANDWLDNTEFYINQHPEYAAELNGSSTPSLASHARQEHVLTFLTLCI